MRKVSMARNENRRPKVKIRMTSATARRAAVPPTVLSSGNAFQHNHDQLCQQRSLTVLGSRTGTYYCTSLSQLFRVQATAVQK